MSEIAAHSKKETAPHLQKNATAISLTLENPMRTCGSQKNPVNCYWPAAVFTAIVFSRNGFTGDDCTGLYPNVIFLKPSVRLLGFEI
jgi:hypothetical protein